MPENETQKPDEELTDVEIAELANKEIRKKDDEIAKLKKDLAKAKLYSEAPEEEVEPLSREECIKRLSDSHISNYDYAEAVVGLVDCELSEGRPNPLGANGKEVYDFFKDVLEECDGDKSRFTAVYQSRIGNDEPKVAAAYKMKR